MLGFDTSVSYLDAMKHGRPSLIFDLIEPLRPRLDRRLIEFISSNTFTKDDFTISIQGVCKLNPQLARRIVSASLPDADVQESVTGFRDRLLSAIVLL
jgi:CRISPR-associated protein Cas1